MLTPITTLDAFSVRARNDARYRDMEYCCRTLGARWQRVDAFVYSRTTDANVPAMLNTLVDLL